MDRIVSFRKAALRLLTQQATRLGGVNADPQEKPQLDPKVSSFSLTPLKDDLFWRLYPSNYTHYDCCQDEDYLKLYTPC